MEQRIRALDAKQLTKKNIGKGSTSFDAEVIWGVNCTFTNPLKRISFNKLGYPGRGSGEGGGPSSRADEESRRIAEKSAEKAQIQRQADLLERAKKEERDERNRLEEKTENNRRHNAAMAMVQSSNDQQATILNNVQKMVAL
jgi:hypothetical protein